MSRILPSRPLSPHLQIYRFTLLMASSILHRLTGAALYAGVIGLVAGLVAVQTGPDAYGAFQRAAQSLLGKLVLFGFSWALLHHAFGGVRHLIWDTGAAFDLPRARALAALNYAVSFGGVLALWLLAGAW